MKEESFSLLQDIYLDLSPLVLLSFTYSISLFVLLTAKIKIYTLALLD